MREREREREREIDRDRERVRESEKLINTANWIIVEQKHFLSYKKYDTEAEFNI